MKQEANSSILFRHWWKVNYHKFESCSLEMKDSRGKDTFNVKEWKEEQRNHALACKSDKGNFIRTTGTTGMADYHYLRNAYAYVVIKYPKMFAIIDTDDLMKEVKGLSITRATEIAIEVIKI